MRPPRSSPRREVEQHREGEAGTVEAAGPGEAARRGQQRRRDEATLAALLSGVVWSLVPLLCAGYTAPETLFYLIVTCGRRSAAR
jgi:hypothetical protein